MVLPKISHDQPEKMTYTHGTYSIHYVASAPSEHGEEARAAGAGGLTYLVVADGSVPRRVCFAFLADLRRRFEAAFPAPNTQFDDLPNYGCGSFNADLRELLTHYGTDANKAGTDDAIISVRREIDDVRGIMSRNIEGLLERGERIDLLVDKTDRLGGNAREFRVRSRGLRRKMWWKNVKLMSLLGLVLVLILVTIIIAVKNRLG